MLLISVIVSLMSSCASTTYLNNDTWCVTERKSFGDYDVKNKTFYIESGDESVSSSDLEFKYYAGYYAENLKIKGAIETADKENADICILLNYCITDKSYQETIPIPEFGRTSIASTTTKGSTTTYQYNYGTTGYHYVQNNVSNYLRVVNVYAYDNKSRDSEPVMLWKTNYKSEGYSGDLRKVIPYMLYSDNYFFYGENEDYLFKCWSHGQMSSPNFFGVEMNKSNYYGEKRNNETITFVQKGNNETIVCVVKWGYKSYKFSSELYIVCNGKQTKASYAESFDSKNAINYQLGSNIRNESGVRYFVFHFPVDLGDADSFEIGEYTNSNHNNWNSWGIVHLNK